MRTNADFLKQLRVEIIETQKRRDAHIKSKLTFIVALLGIGVSGEFGEYAGSPLLFIVPFVAFMFDLYLIGEDFSIKRAGTFIKDNNATPHIEKQWEQYVNDNWDWCYRWACPITSFIVLLVATLGILSELGVIALMVENISSKIEFSSLTKHQKYFLLIWFFSCLFMNIWLSRSFFRNNGDRFSKK